ncbi:unnamed protein product [Nippostrongylus brasiliensis]|uniref:RING/U-box superfamily protein n=1 Tax=Nippostrongylus brasiliensis TaxID=27835 RepID=A0A158R0J3_NIPBR|nr:unnamed protein product [Nippostrongylus brasiliensis]
MPSPMLRQMYSLDERGSISMNWMRMNGLGQGGFRPLLTGNPGVAKSTTNLGRVSSLRKMHAISSMEDRIHSQHYDAIDDIRSGLVNNSVIGENLDSTLVLESVSYSGHRMSSTDLLSSSEASPPPVFLCQFAYFCL